MNKNKFHKTKEIKQEAAKTLKVGSGMPYEFCYDAINNVMLCSFSNIERQFIEKKLNN